MRKGTKRRAVITYQEEPIKEFIDKPRQVIVLRGSVQTDEVGIRCSGSILLHPILQLVTKPRFLAMEFGRGDKSIECLDCSSRRGLEMQHTAVGGQKIV